MRNQRGNARLLLPKMGDRFPDQKRRSAGSPAFIVADVFYVDKLGFTLNMRHDDDGRAPVAGGSCGDGYALLLTGQRPDKVGTGVIYLAAGGARHACPARLSGREGLYDHSPPFWRARIAIEDGGVIAKLTLLHIVLAALACGSLYLAWREVRRRYISQWRLLVPPTLGLGAALGLALIQIVLARQPGWTFLLALAVGLLAGGLRGGLMRVEHDLYRPMVAVSVRARFVLLWVAVVVAAAVAVEIVGARAAPELMVVRYVAALAAMAGAAAMQGRAIALAVQLNRHYADIRKAGGAPPVPPPAPPLRPPSSRETPPW